MLITPHPQKNPQTFSAFQSEIHLCDHRRSISTHDTHVASVHCICKNIHILYMLHMSALKEQEMLGDERE